MKNVTSIIADLLHKHSWISLPTILMLISTIRKVFLLLHVSFAEESDLINGLAETVWIITAVEDLVKHNEKSDPFLGFNI